LTEAQLPRKRKGIGPGRGVQFTPTEKGYNPGKRGGFLGRYRGEGKKTLSSRGGCHHRPGQDGSKRTPYFLKYNTPARGVFFPKKGRLVERGRKDKRKMGGGPWEKI